MANSLVFDGGVRQVDVAVVGRGPIGAAAALALAQRGDLRVAWVGKESLPQPQPAPAADWDARVYALSDAARQLLSRLKVWDALDRQRIAPVYDMHVFPRASAEGAGARELHFDAYEARSEALAWIVEGSNLNRTLERAIGFSAVQVIGANLGSIDRADPRFALLHLEDGTRLRARLVVGADGAGSPTRDQAGVTVSAHDYSQTAVVANFQTGVAHGDSAWQWFGAHGVLALLPLPGRHCSMVWSAPHALAQELLQASGEELAARVDTVSAQRLGPLRTLGSAQAFPLRRISVDRSVAARIALVGDAAHVVHPLAGQGMNLGFGDVAALAQVIAQREPFRDVGDQLLLRRYERQRREPVLAVSSTMDALQKLFDPASALNSGPGGRPLQSLRDLGWGVVARSGWIRRRLIELAAA